MNPSNTKAAVPVDFTRISTYMITRLLVVDAGIALGGTISWLLHLTVHDWQSTALLCGGVFVLHAIVWMIHLWLMLRPVQAWVHNTGPLDDAQILALDRRLEGLPTRLSMSYSLAWLGYFGSIALLGWFVIPEVLSFGRLEITSVGFQLAAVVVGAPLPVYALSAMMADEIQAKLGKEIVTRGLEESRSRVSVIPSLIVLSMCLVLSTSFWLLGTSWLAQGKGAREITRIQLEQSVRDCARVAAQGEAFEGEDYRLMAREALPEGLGAAGLESPVAAGELLETHDRYAEVFSVAVAVGDGRWVLGEAEVVFDRRSFWIGAIVVIMALVWWAGASIAGVASTLTRPLARLQVALLRIVEVGDLHALGRISTARADEIGRVSAELNRMLDVYEELAGVAQAVAGGDLRVSISGRGDLQDAFRNMVERLAELVNKIQSSALEVATAAAEIHATTKEQERAAGRQSQRIREVGAAMERLASSAGDITSAANEVLVNAERTRLRADSAGGELAELSNHIARVGELLELIHGVAERSDLLALNGSLEATRAGEAGRGFALVAGEMRRLAERVTGTVKDVRTTISSVDNSNEATVEATRASRELAEGTTEAARVIVESTATQDAETKRVSEGVRDITTLLSSSEVAMVQTHETVAGLREQAEELEALVNRFDL